MNSLINQLIDYALSHNMVEEADVDYCANKLIDLFGEPEFERVPGDEQPISEIMAGLLAQAVKKGIIEDTVTQKDLLDAKIMDIVMPRPSEVVRTFVRLEEEDPRKATDWFYDLSIRSNYIHKDRIDKNIKFEKPSAYGNIQITINLSKPEKDPKDIAAARFLKASSYPKCLLCKENVGFAGTMSHPARQNHRIIPLDLAGEHYFLQYSPYTYYNEHCIVFNEKHVPMHIDHSTFCHLAEFIDQFPHYTIGSNSDIPIVGGSILTHDHYQGGRHHFPMEDAPVRHEDVIGDVQVELLKWPLTTLRLRTADKDKLIALSDLILKEWIAWEDPACNIIRETDGVRHNGITPILRKKGEQYEMDLVLRNNRTSEEYPDGIFHPHKQHHHIKKENIGLIEVMGLAVLPPRLKEETALIQEVLRGNTALLADPRLEKHLDWIAQLQQMHPDMSNLDAFMEQAITDKFVLVMEDAGVYKNDAQGMEGALRFMEQIKKAYDQNH